MPFKNFASFTRCITKIDETRIDDAEDLVMLMYNLLEYNLNYSDTTGSLWFYSKDETTNFVVDVEKIDVFTKKFRIRQKKSQRYETKTFSRQYKSLVKDGNYEERRVKITNTRLKKFGSAAKIKAEATLKIIKKNFQGEEFPYELFLTARQKT